jgi:hypothetical protein
VVKLAARCERARIQAALAPDGELANDQMQQLMRHLAACAACAEDIRAITSLLRRDQRTGPSGSFMHDLRDCEAG